MVFQLGDNMNTAYSENLTTSLENSRNSLRRIARNGDSTEFSNQSILNVIERFVKTVNTMDETILVPCRLMDLKVGDENDPACDHINKTSHHHHHHNNKKTQQTCVKELLNSADLFHIYHMLNGVKDGLQWGQFNDIVDEQTNNTVEKQTTTTVTTTTTTTTTTATPTPTPNGGVKGHVRRPSTVSVASTNSTTSIISDTESEAGSTNEADSGIEETGQESEYDGQHSNTDRIANNFRKHLEGLTQSLKQMTDVAQYLTYRYQHDIGGPV